MPAQPDFAGASKDRLQFSDAASFQAWRERLPLTNAGACQAALAGQARLLAAAQLAPTARLELLELLRELAATVLGEIARKYRGRPVPLDDDERAVWEGVVAVWFALAVAYDSLIGSAGTAPPQLAPHLPRLCQRALRLTGLAMLEHSRVYRTVPAALWKQLHRVYRQAENAGVAAAPVDDPVGRAPSASSCAAAYVHALLMQLAQPDALSLQQMDTVDRWLDRWEGLVGVATEAPPAGAIPRIAVDLAGDKGASILQGAPGAALRYLHLDKLSVALRQAGAGLKQGNSATQLGLGNVPRDACDKLLVLLHVQWCAAGTGRADERTPGGLVVTISPNLASIHYHMTGRAFRQPGGEISARERQNIDMMGFISESADRALVSQRSASVETWVIVNKSASGFLGMCKDPKSATHVSHNQLLGLKNPSNNLMYLGTVQRLNVDDAGGIWVGLRLITSSAQAVAVRNPTALGADAVKYERALLVPEDAARKVPASVLLLPGWYAGNRQLDLHADRPWKLKLLALLDAGPNFERATYAVA
jgi:hypothetical protein